MKKLFVFLLIFFGFVTTVFAAKATGEIIEMPANPEKGFHWGYVLYLPKTMDTSKPLPFLFVMNDNGYFDTQEENIKSVLERFESSSGFWVEYGIADGVGVPMVMPMVLRKKDEPTLHTQDFNRAVFLLKDGPYARLDLQVLAMLKDARKKLKERHIRTQKKFLIAGFSAAGAFGNKLAFLHPKNVLAAVVGGEVYPTLPFETYHGVNLIFPVGAYDVKEHTGKRFNKKAWQKIPILIVNGGDDYNDPLPYHDVFGEEDSVAVLQVFGEGTTMDRWNKAREILTASAPNVQTHTYPHVDHDWEKQDVILFLNAHKNGGPLKKISPKDTSVYPAIFPLPVTKLYWGYEAKEVVEPGEEQYLGTQEINLLTTKHVPFWVGYKGSCAFDVLYQGKPVLENVPCRGLFEYPKREIWLQTVRFSDEDVAALKKTGGHTFSLRARYPHIWDVPAHLTFTIP